MAKDGAFLIYNVYLCSDVMKVLIVSTSERIGGAAVAASRLCDALNNNGVKARMLVRDKQSQGAGAESVRDFNPTVSEVSGSQWRRKWHFLWERLTIYWRLRMKREHLFEVDTASSGFDITRLPEFQEADVIHLHWVNQGMLSLKGIDKILRTGKPVIWTMHDMWPATAICHLTLGCRQFMSGCHHCKYLPGGGSENDLAARVWRRKERLLAKADVTFVTCSRWLEGEAKGSALLKGHTITSIPNPIDTRLFCPGDRREARQTEGLPEDGNILLFVCQRVTMPNKGMSYLIEACTQLVEKHSELAENTTVVMLGSHADEVASELPLRTVALGYVDDEQRMARLYRAADLFVLPSLSENLPNTIMEAMACGVPCLAFRVGGIPEEIDHQKNGYVANYKDAADLARGMYWILCEADHQQLSSEAVRKVTRNYSQASVSVRYTEVYQQAIARKHFKL